MTLRIAGVVQGDAKNPQVIFPFTLLTNNQIKSSPPELILNAKAVEDVPVLKEELVHWLQGEFGNGKDDFQLSTNELRVQQAMQGFLLFRVVMGMIVGISVLVGGIGVMNVLLISVTERTVEIGIRKAVGANKRDIILQFLAESVTVSAFGSFLGLVLGVLGTMIMVPVIKALTHVPFQAAYTLNTLSVIAVISLLTGVIFGTYPAMRAARLDPVEAIRRE
jgi:putative ABC transport system permease protein